MAKRICTPLRHLTVSDKIPASDRPSAISVDSTIRRLEREHDLLRHMVDGWCAWVVLRHSVQWELVYDFANFNGRTQRFSRRLIAIREAIKDASRLAALRPSRYLVKTYVSGLMDYVADKNKFKDVWFDDLLLNLGSFVKLEGINNPTFLVRRKNALVRGDLSTSLFELIAGLLSRFSGNRHVEHLAKEFSQLLQCEFGSHSFSEKQIARQLSRFLWLKRFYRWVIRRVRPAYLLTADPCEFSIVAAARELGVPVIELQHGHIDPSHSAYSWTDYALRYKPKMPIPDYIFTYGQYWNSVLRVTGFWGDAVRAVGSLRVDQYRRLARTQRHADRIQIVWATQGLAIQQTLSFITAFLRETARLRNLKLFVKLHPTYDFDKTPYQVLESDERVQISAADEQPSTFELLARADLHIGISSSCHYDALAFQVPTVVLPFANYEIMKPLLELKHALLVSTPLELLHVVEALGDFAVPHEIGDFYFSHGALDNMRKELEMA
jgi:hypothetical protein